jgi:hypothetical protein
MITYKSELFTMSATASDKRQVPTTFMPVQGPRGGRNVVTKFYIRVTYSLTTGGAQTIAKGGHSLIIKDVKIRDAQGELWKVSGGEIRAKHIEEHGRQALADPAAQAINLGPIAYTMILVIDLCPRYKAKRRWDFAIPVDTLITAGGNAIEFATEAAAAVGTGGVTFSVAPQVQWFAECREEMDLESHARREVQSYASAATTDLYMPFMGAYCRSASLFKPADSITGGASLASITGITCTALGLDDILPSMLQQQYLVEGNADAASTGDPFVVGTAIPVIIATEQMKLTDMFRHDGNVLLRALGNTVTSLPILMDTITRKTDRSVAAEASQSQGGQKRIKTAGKSQQDPGAWRENPLGDYMPGKF